MLNIANPIKAHSVVGIKDVSCYTEYRIFTKDWRKVGVFLNDLTELRFKISEIEDKIMVGYNLKMITETKIYELTK